MRADDRRVADETEMRRYDFDDFDQHGRVVGAFGAICRVDGDRVAERDREALE